VRRFSKGQALAITAAMGEIKPQSRGWGVEVFSGNIVETVGKDAVMGTVEKAVGLEVWIKPYGGGPVVKRHVQNVRAMIRGYVHPDD
jgi:hypothetical protein